MSRLILTISGNKVQNIGYRLFLLEAMKQCGAAGLAVNLGNGKQVSIEAWGTKKQLQNFVETIQIKKPKFAGTVLMPEPIFDEEKQPAVSKFLNEKMDLTIEQLGKIVKGGLEIKQSINSLPKRIAAELRA